MSKRILILEGSPRKNGNTDLLSDEFSKGVTDAGNTFDKIYLKDKKINGCLGCGVCQNNGGICIQKDDMTEIYHKINEADVIVLASPVYFYSWTSWMKAVIDRTYSLEQTLTNKKFYMISAGAAPMLKYMDNMTQSYELYLSCFRAGTIENGGVLYGLGASRCGDVSNSDTMRKAYEMGKAV